MKDYLTVGDLGSTDLSTLLELSAEVKAKPDAYGELLAGETVLAYFTKPSTRTRVSFGTAIARLGGQGQFVGPADMQLGRGETIADTARVVSRYVRAVLIRTFDHGEVEEFAGHAQVPVINALTDRHHPCQALADVFTIAERYGRVGGVRLAYVGAGNNVANSLIEMSALAGMSIRIATPPELPADLMVAAGAARRAVDSGGTIEWGDDPLWAVAGADVVYTDVWLSMGDPPDQREERRRLLERYRVDEELFSVAGDDALFMHCLPSHRGDEVTDAVIDGPRSVTLEQAENRLYTGQAVLVALLTGQLTGVE